VVKDKIDLKKELTYLGLYHKAREIDTELGQQAALSYIKASYRLLSKVYHPDLNPLRPGQAKITQQRLNRLSDLIERMSDAEIMNLIRRDARTPEQRKTRILVVEDEFGLQDVFGNVFLMEGYDVRVAVDGESGYQAFCEFEPDLVFTDVVMPKMDGLQLVRKIRRIDPHIRVIFTSGFFGIKDLKQELDREILKYNYRTLAKPFKLSYMLEMVKIYLNDRGNVNFVKGI
jgi:CheY-like chemotaxis protein